ncbi:BrnA antitoxin family protein [Methylobacterium sp. A54F]
MSDSEEARLQEAIANDPDAAELSDAQLAALRPAGEVLPPSLFEALTRRDRPASPKAAAPVTMQLDPDVVSVFKLTGRGWQTRINRILREAALQVQATEVQASEDVLEDRIARIRRKLTEKPARTPGGAAKGATRERTTRATKGSGVGKRSA